MCAIKVSALFHMIVNNQSTPFGQGMAYKVDLIYNEGGGLIRKMRIHVALDGMLLC